MQELETAIFGGGCFWCTEALFKELRGVVSVMPGYVGGTVANPTYEQVSTGKTGHAEAIKIEFDPAQISYNQLLTVFFATHDPTTLNRQGNDVGTQYRSIILYTSDEQKRAAEAFIKKLNESDPGGRPVVTEIKPLGAPESPEKFYDAENYHRDYFANNRSQGYCQVIIEPKVEKLQKEFAELLKHNAKE
jgi:peptide-methionine (S)-S-oxide reductase